jgi:hypothetical protein
MLHGFDVVTLVVVVALVGSLLVERRSRWATPAQLVETSLLAYLAYTYAYYVLGTGFTSLMLLHAAVLATAVTALVLAVKRLDPVSLAQAFSSSTRTRLPAVVLATLAIALGSMWVVASVRSAATGEVPPGSALVETDVVVHLGVVLDLVLLVPLYTVAAVQLWRRSPWGFVTGTVALVAGLLHQVSYVVALVAQHAADVPGAAAYDPAEPVIVAVYAVGLLPLIAGLRHPAAELSGPPKEES